MSAILLALEEPTFSLNQLTRSDRVGGADGEIFFNAVKVYLENIGIVPYAKVGEMLDQFTFIQRDVTLNKINVNLEMTPLKYLLLLSRQRLWIRSRATQTYTWQLLW